MPVQKYSNYLEVNPLFESVVDIDADQRNPKLWQEYIVGKDMETLVEFLCQSLGNEAPDLRRSFWVHGSYGTGKSYAAIFVKHLLEEKPEIVDAFMANHQMLAPYRTRFMKCRRNGDYLVIWKTGCTGIRSGDMMLLEAEKAVRDALIAKFGDEADLGSGSLLNAVKAKLKDDMINWENVLESTTLGDDYDSVEELRSKLDSGDLKALQRTAAIIRQRGWGLVDNLETFKAWIAEVIDANNLNKSGIFFIWDEFTEYVNHSDDHTVMQQISEFCKVKPFFMLYVVHRSDEMVDSMGKDRYQMITNRFHTAEFHISADASYDLIANSFSTRANMDEYWKEERKAVVKEIKPFLPDMAGLDDKISEQIELLCPMHPMTIKLLARVAESYAAAQRTLFRFMKDQSVPDQGFIGYINKYGPSDQAKWLTPEWLWDYFFTRESDFSDKDTKAAEFIRHFEESRHLVESDENTFRVFKVAMLLLAIMSSTKGVYGGVKSQGGISATVETSGILDASNIHELSQKDGNKGAKAMAAVAHALQRFVMQDHERESIMSEVLTLMTGRGKVKTIIQKAFHDKAMLAAAFRRFLFSASPDLENIATKLSLQPEPLFDKLHQVMQTAIYTWTEDQVKEKLAGVVGEYIYLDVLNDVIGKSSHDIADARKELANVFRFFRISMEAAEKLNLPWFNALKTLCKVSREGISHESAEEQEQEIDLSLKKQRISRVIILEQYVKTKGSQIS